jgi:hypothetical protein
LKFRIDGLIPTPNPTGMLEGESVTLPVNPFRLVTLMVEKPMEPAAIVRFEGEAIIAKSGAAAGVTPAELDAGTEDTTPPNRRKRDSRRIGTLKKTTAGRMIRPDSYALRLKPPTHPCTFSYFRTQILANRQQDFGQRNRLL